MSRPPTDYMRADPPALPRPSSRHGTEVVVRWVLRVPAGPPAASDEEAHRLFSLSLAVSAARCLLTYVILPIATPLIGPATGGRPAITIPLSILAIIFDIRALRRFWLANHPWRWRMTALYGLVMLFIAGLLVGDVVSAV
jgi:hypothetical protein